MSATKAEVFDLEERDRVVVVALDSEQSSVSVRVGDETVVLPENANRAVRSLLRDLATGVPVHVIPADAELTTQQAADLLGLSRTYVVRLIDQGSLPAHMAGTHRRLLASDVLAYRERRASKLAALGELTEADEELGLSYLTVAPVYILDACVLYPVVLRDLLLTLATLDAFEPRWTDAILDEMTRNVLADHPSIDPARFDARSVGAMRRAFPAASVEGYEHLIDQMDNHPKDRHVAAAAVHVGASALVTYNVRDFDSELLRKRAIAVVTPPRLVGQLVADEPSVVALAVWSMAARKKRPPMSPADVVAAIVRQQGFGALEDSLHVLVD